MPWKEKKTHSSAEFHCMSRVLCTEAITVLFRGESTNGVTEFEMQRASLSVTLCGRLCARHLPLKPASQPSQRTKNTILKDIFSKSILLFLLSQVDLILARRSFQSVRFPEIGNSKRRMPELAVNNSRCTEFLGISELLQAKKFLISSV